MATIERFSPREAAERAGVGREVIYQAIDSGELRALRISPPGAQRTQWRILTSDLDAFIERRMNTVGGAA